MAAKAGRKWRVFLREPSLTEGGRGKVMRAKDSYLIGEDDQSYVKRNRFESIIYVYHYLVLKQ